MSLDLVTHVPYIAVIGSLVIALVVLSIYLLCSTKKTRSQGVQTYYTCLPKHLSDAEKESHGLQTIDIEKGLRVVEGSSQTNTMTSAVRQAPAPPAMHNTDLANAIAQRVGAHGHTAHAHDYSASSSRRQAPPVPQHGDDHDYINSNEWTNPQANEPIGATYRMSQIAPLDTNRELGDDDVISAAFTNDSFENYDDQYINTAGLQQIHDQLHN